MYVVVVLVINQEPCHLKEVDQNRDGEASVVLIVLDSRSKDNKLWKVSNSGQLQGASRDLRGPLRSQ
jgi:hypothetical protein